MKTALDWLEDRLAISLGDELKPLRGFFVIAKEIEKKQIKDAWLSAWKDSMLQPLEDKYYEPEAEQYYTDKYKKQ